MRTCPILAALLCSAAWNAFGADAPLVAPKPEADRVKYELRYRFTQGEVFGFELDEKSEILTASGDNRHLAVNDSSLFKHYRVIETFEDGSARLELVVDRVRMKLTMGPPEEIGEQTPIEYDTASNATPPKQLASLKNTIGRPLAVAKVAADGRLLEMEDRISADGHQNQERNNFLFVLADEPIAVGESWTHSYDVPVRLNPRLSKTFVISQQFKLEAVRNGVARISFTTVIVPRLVDPILRVQFIQKLPRGTIQFDLKRGMIVSQTQKIDETELNVSGQGNLLQVVVTRKESLMNGDAKLSPAAN